jgi:Rod binding domain-containing protein
MDGTSLSVGSGMSAVSAASNAGAATVAGELSSKPKNLKEAGQRFEAMLVKSILDAARPPEDEDSESSLENDGSRTYQGMLGQEIAKSVAEHSRLGLAEAMQRQLGGAQSATTED